MNFRDELKSRNLSFEVIHFEQTTHTSAQAAEALGCSISQIAKSIILKTKESDNPILVVASGTNRVDVSKIEKLVGEKIEKADADFVKEQTGYSIGAVPPFFHENQIQTFLDEDFLKMDEIWAAAGGTHSVFKLTPEILKELTGSSFEDVKE